MDKLTKTKRPVRFFNTTGPCNPWDHYMLPPEELPWEDRLGWSQEGTVTVLRM